MKISSWLMSFTLLTGGTAAYAHTHLQSSLPADGSVTSAAPANIMLKFSEATRVTALTIRKDGTAEQKLAPLPASASSEVTVPAPKLAPGKYVIHWRAIGDDNHVMTGKVQFTIDPAATPATGNTPEHTH